MIVVQINLLNLNYKYMMDQKKQNEDYNDILSTNKSQTKNSNLTTSTQISLYPLT